MWKWFLFSEDISVGSSISWSVSVLVRNDQKNIFLHRGRRLLVIEHEHHGSSSILFVTVFWDTLYLLSFFIQPFCFFGTPCIISFFIQPFCFLKLFTDLLKLQLLAATGLQSTKTLSGIPRVFSYLSCCKKLWKINTQFMTSLVKK